MPTAALFRPHVVRLYEPRIERTCRHLADLWAMDRADGTAERTATADSIAQWVAEREDQVRAVCEMGS